MENDQMEYVPPVEVENYQQFLDYARRAAIVTFEPIYYVTPFEGDVMGNPAQWLRALRLYAIGVELNGILITLMHRINFPPINLDFEEGILDCVAAEGQLTEIVQELETEFHAVPGAPERPSLHDEWIRTLR
ncbi:MAG: hypothetical protein Q6364_02920 [Candidatus Hermodarchaeota archaeon]|nr:hypothetical protein [Candidatus Hermodarchaeota archaeon]